MLFLEKTEDISTAQFSFLEASANLWNPSLLTRALQAADASLKALVLKLEQSELSPQATL